MAYIEKTKTGKFRAHVEKKGVRVSRTFERLRDARDWGTQTEAEILNGERQSFPRETLATVLDLYAQRVSSKKQGGDKELLRIEAFKRDFPVLAGKIMSETTTADWAEWRDKRLQSVSTSAVVRDIRLFSNVYQRARHELGPYCSHSPFTHLSKPQERPPRQQRWRWRIARKVLRHLGFRTGVPPQTKAQEVAYVLLVGLRTAMRLQEIVSLSDGSCDLGTRVATVRHKMQYRTGRPRVVAMQRQAIRLLRLLSDHAKNEGRASFFTMSPAQVDGVWRAQRDDLAEVVPAVADLRIHDTRAEALTRLARRYDVFTLSRISGISDLQVLNERYYRESAEEIAARM